MVSELFYSTLFLTFCFVLLGRCFWIAMYDGCDMYLVLCACKIYTYKYKTNMRTYTVYILLFLMYKSIYRYMYINYNGSEIIYGELISG